jgi:hypothetical protein
VDNLFEKSRSQCSGIVYTFRLLARFSFDLASRLALLVCKDSWAISLKNLARNAQVLFIHSACSLDFESFFISG